MTRDMGPTLLICPEIMPPQQRFRLLVTGPIHYTGSTLNWMQRAKLAPNVMNWNAKKRGYLERYHR